MPRTSRGPDPSLAPRYPRPQTQVRREEDWREPRGVGRREKPRTEWPALLALPELRRYEPAQLDVRRVEQVDEDLPRVDQVLSVPREPPVSAPHLRPPPVIAAAHVPVAADAAQVVLLERGRVRVVAVDQPVAVEPLLPAHRAGEVPRLLVGAAVERVQQLRVVARAARRGTRLRRPAASHPESRVVDALVKPVADGALLQRRRAVTAVAARAPRRAPPPVPWSVAHALRRRDVATPSAPVLPVPPPSPPPPPPPPVVLCPLPVLYPLPSRPVSSGPPLL